MKPDFDFARAKHMIESNLNDEAVFLLEEHITTCGSPDLYVMLGRLLQLISSVEDDPLKRAEECFYSAIRMEADHLDAHIELGWLLYNVYDDPSGAIKYFRNAEEICLSRLSEIRDGINKCAADSEDA